MSMTLDADSQRNLSAAIRAVPIDLEQASRRVLLRAAESDDPNAFQCSQVAALAVVARDPSILAALNNAAHALLLAAELEAEER